MDKICKSISGLKESKIITQKSSKDFTETEKHQIIQEFLNSRYTKREIWAKYTGQEEHGHLLRWMRQLGYDPSIKIRSANFTGNTPIMARKEVSKDFEMLQLKKRISELEDQLKDAEMKAIAFSTMVDLAEKEYNVPIRKKYNTKPSKQ